MQKEVIPNEYKSFEEIKHTREDNSEYWLARELQKALNYTKWENFKKILESAKTACKISEQEVLDHFVEINKMINLAKGAKRKVLDYKLTRYACYLIVMNGVLERKLLH